MIHLSCSAYFIDFFFTQFFRYNIGHVGTALGDLGLAYQAFKVAASVDPTHGEALNNIAVLEMRRQKFDLARSCLNTSMDVGPHLFEPLYNTGKSIYMLLVKRIIYMLYLYLIFMLFICFFHN